MIAILIAGAAIFVVALFWALNKSAVRAKMLVPCILSHQRPLLWLFPVHWRPRS